MDDSADKTESFNGINKEQQFKGDVFWKGTIRAANRIGLIPLAILSSGTYRFFDISISAIFYSTKLEGC